MDIALSHFMNRRTCFQIRVLNSRFLENILLELLVAPNGTLDCPNAQVLLKNHEQPIEPVRVDSVGQEPS